MACRDAPPSALPRNLAVPSPCGLSHAHPSMLHLGCMQAPQSQCSGFTDLTSMLRSRIAVLEEQLATANAQKDAADIGNSYLLRLMSARDTTTTLGGAFAEEVSKLRHKLLVTKLEKSQLKVELHKALLLHNPPNKHSCQCRYLSVNTQSDGSLTALEPSSGGSMKEIDVHPLDTTGPAVDVLIDLTDSELSTSAEGIPELDDSDSYSSTSDDSEEPQGNVVQISESAWDLGGIEHGGFKAVEIFPDESSYVRHFSGDSALEAMVETEKTDVKIHISDNVSPTAKLRHCILGGSNLTESSTSTLDVYTRGLTSTTQESVSMATTTQVNNSSGNRVLDGSFTLITNKLDRMSSSEPATHKIGLGASNWNPDLIRRTGASEGASWGSGKLFSSAQERDIAISMHKRSAGRQDFAFPDMFKYGICYTPGSSVRDVYRTISISGLPSTITMIALLMKVRGGMIVSAILLDTTTITGFHTALVTFLHEHSAVLLEDYAVQHPANFCGHGVKVELLSEPTWPMPNSLRKAIYEHGHTRCLHVHYFPPNISPEDLRRDLRVCPAMVSDRIESMHMRGDNVLELRFESIGEAGKAYGFLTTRRNYKQCKVEFAPDPCAQPLGSLAGLADLSFERLEPDSFETQKPQGLPIEGPRGNCESAGHTSSLDVVTVILPGEKSIQDLDREHHPQAGGAPGHAAVFVETLPEAGLLLNVGAGDATVSMPLSKHISANDTAASITGKQLDGTATREAETLCADEEAVGGVQAL